IMGGIYSFVGPALGAAIFIILNSYIVAWTENWSLVLGLVLLIMVLALPGGAVGYFNEKARNLLVRIGWLRTWDF
ncbi:MAG: hypothetical protein ACLP7A_10020, partial [Desulfobaccales bacterium]